MRTPINDAFLQSDLDTNGFDILGLPASEAANGIPSGGTSGQLLQKTSGTDFDADWVTVSTDGDTGSSGHEATATELLGSIPGTRTAIAALATSGGNFFDSQSFDPCIIVNPDNSNQLIMLFTGMAAPVETGQQTIGRATADIADPTVWTVSNSGNPVITATESYETGGNGLRADSILHNPDDDKLYLFYTAKESGASATCALASSADLGLTWTKLGQVLTPTAPEETCSGMAVLIEGTMMHAVYSYRVSSILEHYRYASASTSNWLSWTKGGVDVYTDSPRWLEWHQLFKLGSTYILAYESGGAATEWDIRFATSTSPSSAFTASPTNPFLVKSSVSGAFDEFLVATPRVVVINGSYYLFYCGALDHATPFGTNHWQMGITPLLFSSQVSSLYVGTDARFTPVSGGVKLQCRNVSTGAWADKETWTNP